MDEHGIYIIGAKDRITFIPFNESSEYTVYCAKQGELLYWYKPDGSNNYVPLTIPVIPVIKEGE